MTISVIITVYNLERFVAAAIESVLGQTVLPDEIIVVDDGSTDRSEQVIKQYEGRVKLVRMERNSGVLPAFLEGVRQSSGHLLAFLDGDDLWMPTKLEKVLAVFERDPQVMMVTHQHQWIDEQGNPTGVKDATHKNVRSILDATKGNIQELDDQIKNSILCYKGIWLGSAFCIRRSVVNWANYTEWVYSMPGVEGSHQDQPLAAYLVYKNPDKRIHLIDEELFQYRVYATNSSGASGNIHSAMRTINRSIATVHRTHDIVSKMPHLKEENLRQTQKLRELYYYRDLYQKNIWAALRNFLFLYRTSWNNGQRPKELTRFLSCMLLGPQRFLKLKTRNRFG